MTHVYCEFFKCRFSRCCYRKNTHTSLEHMLRPYTHTQTHAHTQTHTRTHTYTHTQTLTHRHKHTHTHTHTSFVMLFTVGFSTVSIGSSNRSTISTPVGKTLVPTGLVGERSGEQK